MKFSSENHLTFKVPGSYYYNTDISKYQILYINFPQCDKTGCAGNFRELVLKNIPGFFWFIPSMITYLVAVRQLGKENPPGN